MLFRGSLTETNKDLRIVRDAHAQRSLDKATLHFIRGTEYAHLAETERSAPEIKTKAVNQLRLAALHDLSDIRIHRAYLSAVEKWGNADDISKATCGWIKAAKLSKLSREEGLARKKHGEYWYSRFETGGVAIGVGQEWLGLARDELDDARKLLHANPAPGTNAKFDEARASVCEVLGDVRSAINPPTIPMAGSRYHEALEIYHQCRDGDSKRRVLEKLQRIGIPPTILPNLTDSPSAGVVRALKGAADLQSSKGDYVAAKTTLYSARAWLLPLVAPDDIANDEKTALLSEIERMLGQLPQNQIPHIHAVR